MGSLILGVNTLYRLFCFFKLFIIGGKGLTVISPKFSFLSCFFMAGKELILRYSIAGRCPSQFSCGNYISLPAASVEELVGEDVNL